MFLAMNDFFDDLQSIFDPAFNPLFTSTRHDDNIEDAEIIEEIKL